MSCTLFAVVDAFLSCDNMRCAVQSHTGRCNTGANSSSALRLQDVVMLLQQRSISFFFQHWSLEGQGFTRAVEIRPLCVFNVFCLFFLISNCEGELKGRRGGRDVKMLPEVKGRGANLNTQP